MRLCIFRLGNDGQPIDGLPGARETGVHFPNSADRRRIFLSFVKNRQYDRMPRVYEGALIAGVPCHNPAGIPVIKGGGKEVVFTIGISTFSLDFDPAGSSHFGEIKNSWAGAEVIGEPFVQIGDRNSADQHQLVVVKQGQSVIVADRHCKYMMISCEGDQLIGRPAEKAELGAVLVRRLEVDLSQASHSGLLWTWHTLRRLNLKSMWTQKLQEKFDELEQLRPSSSWNRRRGSQR